VKQISSSHGFMNTYLLVSLLARDSICNLPFLLFLLRMRCCLRSTSLCDTSIHPGDPTVASVWRRQTFSAAVESCTPEMTTSILCEHIPELTRLLQGVPPVFGGISILDSAYAFSRMLHGPGSNSGDVFYRAFVPELGGPLSPREMELTKRCLKTERGELDRVGATIFPGLVKVSQGVKQLDDQAESVQVCHK